MNVHVATRSLAIAFLIFQLGCAKGESDATPADGNQKQSDPVQLQELQGKMFGQDWQFRSGRADQILRSGRRSWVLSFYDQEFSNPCQVENGSNLQVQVQVRNEGTSVIDPADGPFVRIPSVRFADLSRRNPTVFANAGSITITVGSRSQLVVGNIQGEFSPSNFGEVKVAGQFTLPICSRQ